MDIILDSLVDTLNLVPFLFVSFIIMELVEHKINSKKRLKKINKYGPMVGSVLGLVPQCGFSVISATLYSAGVITLGTLFSVFLSTSDEMLPILIASRVKMDIIVKLLLIKFILGLFFGILIDVFYNTKLSNNKNEICEIDDCHCKESLIKSSIIHTMKITFFILIVNILLNLIIDIDMLSGFINDNKIFGPILSSIIGLIPNCASSIVITELYLENILSFGCCVSGLLTGSGMGLVILFKQNKNLKENIIILFLLLFFSSVCGIVINYM